MPWQVDEDLLFSGPCEKRLRQQLRRQYLRADRSHSMAGEDLLIVGVNGCNRDQVRKIVRAGKLSEVMAFAEAFRRLTGRGDASQVV